MAKICCVVVFIMLAGCESASQVDTKDFLQSLDSIEAQNAIYSESIIGKQDEALTALAAIKSQVSGLNDAVQETRRVVETKQVGDMPAYTEAVVVDDESEPGSGKEVIQQSTSASSSATVSDDDVRFEMWTATWCGPCRLTKPRVRAIAKEFGMREPRMLEWDEYKTDPVAVYIHDLPTINVLRRGKSRVTLVGEQTAEAIRAAVQQVRSMEINDSVTTAPDDLTIRSKLPVVNTRWGLRDLEEVNADSTCNCAQCVELRALKAAYLLKPEYQNIGRKVEPETF